MKLKIVRSRFLEGLKSVQNIVAGKGSLPILQNVLLEANGKELRMTTTDLDISIRSICECEVVEHGNTTLPVKLLFNAVAKVAEGEIEVSVDARERAEITAGNAKFKLAGMPESEFPRLPQDEVEISFVHSTSNAGNAVSDVHTSLFGECDLRFSAEYDLTAVDVLFLCSAHGQSSTFLAENEIPEALRIVDLAQDFRDESEGFVYGLPELNRERTLSAHRVANPGCFATAIQLALLPLAAKGLLSDEVHITAITGSTGAGVKPSTTTHFSWRAGNISTYKSFEHQHLKEIGRNLRLLQPEFDHDINFVPLRGDFTRGILASVYTECLKNTGSTIPLTLRVKPCTLYS